MIHKLKALTMIELLIVIIIIWVLATALIPRLKWIQVQARVRAATVQMQDFNTAVAMARVNGSKTLLNITQNGCSDCDCRSETDLRNLPENHACRVNRSSALANIAIAAGMNTWALKSLEKDPWWSPYQLDENEGEGNTLNCTRDSFFSVWPDGSRWWIDNISLNSAPAFCAGAY